MRRLLVLSVCMALVVVGCAQTDSSTSVDDAGASTVAAEAVSATDVVTTTESGAASTAAESSSSETTTTAVAVETTKPQSTTTIAGSADEAVEAFNSSMATIVELSMLVSDELDALKASIREHRSDLIKGDTIEACCSAHIEAISAYYKSMADEIGDAFAEMRELTPWLEDISDSVPDGQMALTESLETIDSDWTNLFLIWRQVTAQDATLDPDAVVDLLGESEAIASIITKIAEVCCSVRLDS